jgi:hypothetical protein
MYVNFRSKAKRHGRFVGCDVPMVGSGVKKREIVNGTNERLKFGWALAWRQAEGPSKPTMRSQLQLTRLPSSPVHGPAIANAQQWGWEYGEATSDLSTHRSLA